MTKVCFTPVNADDLTYKVSFQMTLSELKQLEEQLTATYPSFQLGLAISDCVRQAGKNFKAETKEDINDKKE